MREVLRWENVEGCNGLLPGLYHGCVFKVLLSYVNQI